MTHDQLKIRLLRSTIGTNKSHRETVRGLGLRRVNSISILNNTPEVRGMLRKVKYLIDVSHV
ncbi:large subunit ribosomal protein L30 [Candidatus Kinetoplastibacterium blastocrithidii TCC012E]|uniref:Large ribosomal subunit protein uL30 n=1 Tax=Candidatus Kinetoplastidibacterium blastocrithidiae TCC012E TaxID=1208922 RepID=M1LCH1_9PROT|nr:50S ribosomal protein L30 [Candidatus Kinetoplastibacterium blastocrithidii]AGF50138.1 large subunit ribosomal protein L30 [Candidatus Kinetoplastibacterium blastocrithidii TCC012E]